MPVSFLQIESARRGAGMTVHAMCRAAGIGVGHYYRAKSGKLQPTVKTLERWRRAIAGAPRARRFEEGAGNKALLRSTYRGYVASLAAELGADAAAVLASDPAQRANSDPVWAQAARVRALAAYCVVVEFDLPAARVAAAIGVTRAAASNMLRRVEAFRDDPAVDEMVERIGRLVSGRGE